jgi:malonyl-CoA decarboxylase
VSQAVSGEERAPGAYGALRRLWGLLRFESRAAPPLVRPDLPRDDKAKLRQLMRDWLTARDGEVSARAQAAELGYLYLELSPRGRRRYLKVLKEALEVDGEDLARAARAFLESPDAKSYLELREAVVPPRVRFLKMLNSLPSGFKFLVDLRADLLSFLDGAPELTELDYDLQTLFELWFDVSLLTFEEISWDSRASLLEKLIEYEAVHKIHSWADLKNRLDRDRRCYAFFHPKIPNEPLIFVEVALTEGIPASIHELLDEEAPLQDPDKATTAVFYSISNTQKGLRGISFGTFLLKRVIDDLTRHLPRLKTFVTLSPIPGFRRWLFEEGIKHLEPAELARLEAELPALLDEPGWHHNEALAQALKEPLLRLAACYLLEVQEGGKPLDPVARFHILNGARVERLNWLADTSPSGLDQSLGLMVNYLYKPDELESNHEMFFQEGKIAASPALRRLLRRTKRETA